MINIDHNVVEEEIIKAVKAMSSTLNIQTEIHRDCILGVIGFSSQALITIMGQMEEKLGVVIPNECYIFHDKVPADKATPGIVAHRKLTIKEAATKLIKNARYAKE